MSTATASRPEILRGEGLPRFEEITPEAVSSESSQRSSRCWSKILSAP